MDNLERAAMLDEAGEMLMEVIELVRTAVRNTDQERVSSAYILPHLQAWLDGREMVTITSLVDYFNDPGNVEGSDDDESWDDRTGRDRAYDDEGSF